MEAWKQQAPGPEGRELLPLPKAPLGGWLWEMELWVPCAKGTGSLPAAGCRVGAEVPPGPHPASHSKEWCPAHAQPCPPTPTSISLQSHSTRTFPSHSCRGWWRKTPHVHMAENKRSCFEPNGFIFDKNRAPAQESVQHKHGGFADKEHVPCTPNLPSLAAARMGQIWGLGQGKDGNHTDKTKGKAKIQAKALHWERRVFPRSYHPPQKFPNIFTVPGTALVPKCHDKGKTQGAWLPMLSQPCLQQEKAKLSDALISLRSSAEFPAGGKDFTSHGETSASHL